MIVRRFLAWAQTAPEDPRVGAAAALARAYLSDETCVAERCDAEAALTLLLDDPSPAVLLALAETLAESDMAPRHIVSALAAEPGRAGEIILEHSPVLGEADLIERVATGDAGAQAAVARRVGLTAPVAAALAEVGEREAVIALAANRSADCPDFAVTRIIERFGQSARIRDALAGRTLSVTQRHALHVASTRCDAKSAEGEPSWRAERARRESIEREALRLASGGEREREEMVGYLRATGQLTAGLLLRAAAQADSVFVASALADLSRMNRRRVTAIVEESKGSGFAALCAKAGLGHATVTALRAALEAHRWIAARGFPVGAASRAREACRSTLDACRSAGLDTHDVSAMFRRLELEFSREAARDAAEKLLEQHRLETEGPLLLGAPMLKLPAPESESAVPDTEAEADETAGDTVEIAMPAMASDPEFAEDVIAIAEPKPDAAGQVVSIASGALGQAIDALKAALEPFSAPGEPTLHVALTPDPTEAEASRAKADRDWAALLASAIETDAAAPVAAEEWEPPACELPHPTAEALEAVVADLALVSAEGFVGASFLAELTAVATIAAPEADGAEQAEPVAAGPAPVVEIPSQPPVAPRSSFAAAKPDLSAWERVFEQAAEISGLDPDEGREMKRETMAEMLREAVEAMQRRSGVEVARERAAGEVRAA
jgi:uncharacterized protein (DUF2336 family)